MSVFKVKDNNDQWITVSTGGVGVPAGGSTAQVLVKASNADYSTRWSEQVHVGGNPPTDEGVAIWLDTDEAGMSAVSSVNAKTGTVVLDADDVGAMAEWELLWENASSTSEFAAQTISEDLTEYDMLLIKIRCSNNQQTYGYSDMLDYKFAKKGETTTLWSFNAVINSTSNNAYAHSRNVTPSDVGIEFGAGYNRQINTTSAPTPSSNNYSCVPLEIYGIKGVITT